MAISNVQMWNYLRDTYPDFARHTSKGTAALFTSVGFEQLSASDASAIGDFFSLSVRTAFQKFDISKAKDIFAEFGLVEVYDTPNGGFTQRISIDSIKPVSPGYKGLDNGDSVDPYVVRKPGEHQRFFEQNFDYQSFVTIQKIDIKRIFLEEYGMSGFIAGIMAGLKNGYTIQKYVNVLEAINVAINSLTNPLKDTQVMEIEVASKGNETTAELTEIVETLKNIGSSLEIAPLTGAYNANGFETYVDADSHVLLLRAGYKNKIATRLMVGAFNPDQLSIPFAIKEVADFGGIYYTATVNNVDNTRVYPCVDAFGVKVDGKWATTAGASEENAVTVTNLKSVDPNADIIGVVAQKGLVFENIQNAYSVDPIYNPRGMYFNFWANCPNNTVAVDANYNLVVLKETEAQADEGGNGENQDPPAEG